MGVGLALEPSISSREGRKPGRRGGDVNAVAKCGFVLGNVESSVRRDGERLTGDGGW